MPKTDKNLQPVKPEDNDESDEWYGLFTVNKAVRETDILSAPREKRIFSTGCAGTGTPREARYENGHRRSNATMGTAEQTKMNDCYFEKKDWRVCQKEVGC